MRKIKFLNRSIGVEWFLLFAIVVAGVFLRIEAGSHLTAITPDGVAYIYHSLQVFQGIGEFERRGPLFQGLLVISYMIFGVSFESSVLVPQLFGSLIPILMFFVGKRFFDPETGLVAALLSTLNPMLTNMSVWVLRETLSVTLILMLVLVAHLVVKVRSTKKSLILSVLPGVISGLIILTREEMIVIIPPAYVAYLFLMEEKKWVFIARSSVFLMTTFLVMSPWLIYSLTHFGNPLYSYAFYIDPIFSRSMSGEPSSGASTTPLFLRVLAAFFFGLWRVTIEMPAVLSLFCLAFAPFGIIFTLRRRGVWILYLITGLDLAVVSILASLPAYFDRPVMLYSGAGPTRFFFSTAMPFIVIVAFGIRKLFPFLEDLNSKSKSPNPRKRRSKILKKRTLLQRKFWKMPSVSAIILLGIIVLGIVSYLPAYVFTFEDFDERSARPFLEAAKYLNSTGGNDGVFTMHPDLLSRYYKGTVYKLPANGGFELILAEALKKGVKYVLIESTSVTSEELIRLYYKSMYPKSLWTQIPSEFVLVESEKRIYGLFFLQTEVWFKAAILGTTRWETHAPWEQVISLLGGSTESFDDTVALSSLDLSEYDIVVFADFLRPLEDTERAYLEAAIQDGLTVIVSGLSPFYFAGNTANLTRISSWFGATSFSEAPKQERWKVKFTEEAVGIMEKLVLDREYAFYTNSDWSTPTGAVTKPESVVYAYRVNDQASTIFAHKFGSGSSIFIGPRFGFSSPDEETFRTFLQSLIISYLTER